ncbi:MAG: CoA transferase subunit A, partial [Planctomycetota bacterium]
EAAYAAKRVIVVCEELVDEAVVRSDPNRTILPGFLVDAVVVEPFGCHPSYAQGYYDRDNDFYVEWDRLSRDPASFDRYLEEWVRGVPNRRAYVERLPPGRLAALRADTRLAAPVNYGF